jgi:hypothetical protein
MLRLSAKSGRSIMKSPLKAMTQLVSHIVVTCD